MKKLTILMCAGLMAPIGHVSAITTDVARKCNAAVVQAFPPRTPGNPALGSAKGDPQAVRAFFNKCVANNGKVDDDAARPNNGAAR